MSMETGAFRSPDALAGLIAVNITPLAGVLFLGWYPGGVLISYFVDTFVGFCVVMFLLMIHVTGDDEEGPIRGWKRWAKAIGALVFLSAIVALPLALPLFFVLGGDTKAQDLMFDPSFLGGIAVQVLMSVLTAMRVHRQLLATHDDDRILAGRMLFLAARWFAVVIAVGTGLVPLLGARFGSLVLIAIYAGASVYFELFPSHALRFVRGKAAGPIRYEADLESRAARNRGDVTPR